MADELRESRLPCAVLPTREAADAAAARLAALEIDAVVVVPGPRYHHLPPGTWEVRVPATLAARARAVLHDES